MFTVQHALINHIKQGINHCYPYLNSDNVKAYAGELSKDKIVQLTQFLPSVLVMPQPSLPLGPSPQLNLDIIIVTKSDSFDKIKNQNNNMQLSEELYRYFQDKPFFAAYTGESYRVEYENLEIKLVAIDNAHCVVVLDVNLTEQ